MSQTRRWGARIAASMRRLAGRLDERRAAAAREAEGHLRAELDRAHTVNQADRTRLTSLEDSLRAALAQHNEQLAAAREHLVEARQRAEQHATELAAEEAQLRAIRDVVLDRDADDQQLRVRLLAELLPGGRPSRPEAEPDRQPDRHRDELG